MVRPTDHWAHPIVGIVPNASDPDHHRGTGPAAVARAYLESFATRDPAAIAAHVADDFVNEHTAALGSGCAGKSSYEARLVDFLADMVDLRYEVEDLVVEGSRVAAFYTMTANWQGDAPVRVRGVQRLVVEGDTITHRTDYWDSAVFLAQASAEARAALAPFGIR